MGQRYTTSISFGSTSSDNRQIPPVSHGVGSPQPRSDEFAKFEDLTRKLAGVPKGAIATKKGR